MSKGAKQRDAASVLAALDALHLASGAADSHDLMRSVTKHLIEWSGCDAIGVRLRDGVDFPYFEQLGFSADFVQTENTLCQYGEDGELLCDPVGDPVLDCMCGTILQGRCDPTKPFFTEYGSFWSNATTKLLASTSEADRQGRTRNRCNGDGYESVLLIPLRSAGETFGLLQLNSRREDCFPPATVSLLEQLAAGIAEALAERRTREALRQAEDRYRGLFETLLEGFAYCQIITDNSGKPIDWVYLAVNDAFTRLTGLTGVVGRRVTDVIPGIREETPEVFEIYGRVAATGLPERFDINFTPLGSWLNVAASSPEPGRFVAVFEDVTERKRAEEALLLTQFAVDHAADGVLWISMDGHICYANESLARMLGYTRTELLNMSIYEIATDTTPDLFWARWSAVKEGRTLGFEREYRTKAGVQVPVEVTANYLSDDGSGFLCAFVRDIRERKEAERALRASEEQLRQAQKMEAVGQLAGGIAHDFNNLLTAIIGYADLALQKGADSSTSEEVCEIRRAAERASSLTRQVLAFSRRQALSPQVVCLNDVLNAMQQLLRRTLGEDVEIACALAPDLGTCEVDVHQFERVIMNLAVNARDAMPGGGRLVFSTANADASGDGLDGTAGACVELVVADTGRGIAATDREHIFEPFFTTKRPGEGTGLGLSSVYGTVHQSKGTIRVESALGRGTTFTIRLPRTTGHATPPAEHAPHSEGTAGSETVLLVEDEPSVRRLVSRVLRGMGYTVLAASDADEALPCLRDETTPIDLLLTDVVLPGSMQGNQLARLAHDLRPNMPVLYMSGYTRDAMVHNGRLDPGIEFLEKPFSPETLGRHVRHMLDDRGPTASQ